MITNKEVLTDNEIQEILKEQGFKKVGFFRRITLPWFDKTERLPRLLFNKGINGKQLGRINPKLPLFRLNDTGYLVVIHDGLYIKENCYEPE